jgi:transposase
MIINPTQGQFNHIVAFDVGKQTLVVHILPGDTQHTIPNTSKAATRFLRQEANRNAKNNLGPLLVVCEATGGYERHVLDAAVGLGLACHRAHGSRVRFFAKYKGLLAKTDPIDARAIALFGRQTEDLRLYEPPSADEAALRELKVRRDQILGMMIAEGNRLEHAHHPSVTKSIKAHILSLQKAIDGLEAEIAKLLQVSKTLAPKARLMRSVKGVGIATISTLLAHLPGIGRYSKTEVAAIAGLAPINNDSGKSHLPRHIEAGRSAIRKTLYMAAVVAMTWNPAMKTFAAELKSRGKPFKVVIVAVMRKLLVILNAVVRSGEPWKGAKPA